MIGLKLKAAKSVTIYLFLEIMFLIFKNSVLSGIHFNSFVDLNILLRSKQTALMLNINCLNFLEGYK